MKFIKLFEELNPEVYINAGNKLLAKSQKGRANNLIKYGNDLNKPVPVDVIVPAEYNYNIYQDLGGDPEILKCKFVDLDFFFCGVDEEDESFDELIKDDSISLYYDVEFKFKTHTSDIMSPFEFSIYIYDFVKGRKKQRKLNLDIRLKYSWNNQGAYGNGIFADRRSANRFIKEILPKVFDDPRIRIAELVSFLDKPTEDLEEIYNIFDKIDIHYLYGDSCDNIDKHKSILKKSV